MGEPLKRKAVYGDLLNIPDNWVGEIMNGEVIATPRPSGRHANAAAVLGGEIIPPFRLGRGGPGGWVILMEPEVLMGENLLVPDLAGWRRERFAEWPRENWFSIIPDWICEILSPGTAQRDRIQKMRIYAESSVNHVWLIDPVIKTLEIFRLQGGKWLLLGSFSGEDRVRAEPFSEVEIPLVNLWID